MKVALALFTLLVPSVYAERGVVVDPDSQMGPDNLDAYGVVWDLAIDADCNYEFTMDWQHPSSYPVGTEEFCQTGEIFPGDGKSYLVGRWAYERFPEWFQTVTGIDHLGLDWNPCGHPPDAFLVPHYDIHWYLVSPEYRRNEMLCTQIGKDVPVCLEDVPDNAAFFEVDQTAGGELVNAPANFTTLPDDAITLMGMHALDRNGLPALGAWNDPVYVIGTHAKKIIAWEVMLPFRFNTGDQNHFYQEHNIQYVNQHIQASPTSYALSYNAQTQQTSLILRAPANVCKLPETDAPTTGPPSGDLTTTTIRSAGLSIASVVTMLQFLL